MLNLLCTAALTGWASGHPALRASTNDQPVVGEIRTEVFTISENRQPGGRCHVHLKFTGSMLTNFIGISRVRVLHAVDDVGTDLVSSAKSDHVGWGNGAGFNRAGVRGWYDERSLKARYAGVVLGLPSRSARFIRELTGEVELYWPTLQNGGVVVVEEFRAQPGIPIKNLALQKLEVKLTCLTKEAYETSKVLTPPDATRGRPLILPEDQAADGLFPGILGYPNSTPRNYVVLRIDDPQQRVTSFAFRGPDGRLLPVNQQKSAKGMRGFYFDALVPERVALYVYLTVPEAVEKVSFKVENIPLP
ncbi:MAG: hypothetical protein IH623_05465 [Verrucomicrobia bacterium]|nr:hypothetical protein [Verrucomicrobiota bacterium]